MGFIKSPVALPDAPWTQMKNSLTRKEATEAKPPDRHTENGIYPHIDGFANGNENGMWGSYVKNGYQLTHRKSNQVEEFANGHLKRM